MIRTLCFLLATLPLTITSVTPCLQAQAGPAGFPVDTFDAHAATAGWIAACNRAEWLSAEAVRALPASEREKVGGEQFCYQANGRWHAVYGRSDPATGHYTAAVHMVESDSGYRRVNEPVDSDIADAFGRAIQAARARLPDMVRTQVAMLQFVRRLKGGAVEVWLIPGRQSAGYLLHGMEWRYAFDPDGRVIVDSSRTGRRMDPIRPDTTATVVLDDHEFEAPRVASLFVLLAYRHWFHQVYIDSRKFRSTLYGDSGREAWIHAVRGEEKPVSSANVPPNAPADQPVAARDSLERARLESATAPYIAQARATYPAARHRFLAGLPSKQGFFVTTRLHDAAGHWEQVFIAVDSIVGDSIVGRIYSKIMSVQGYRLFDRYRMPEAEIIDWLITRPDGTEEGNVVGKFLDTYRPER